MAISKEQLSSIIMGKARNLCSPDGVRLTESYTGQQSASMGSDGALEFNNVTLSSLDSNGGNMNYNNTMVTNSRMPEHIKQSMMENVIDTSSLSQTSVLDSLGIKPELTKPKTVVRENVSYTQPQSSIDYSIIKAIVNECLNEYFNKQQLNESSSLKTIGLKEGVISLVDNKGNVFKAKLEKIGNKNDK